LAAARPARPPRTHDPARSTGPRAGRDGAGNGSSRRERYVSAVSPSPLLEVEHLTMRFGGLVAVDDLSFTAYAGEITAIIGPNGAGKTTVFNCLTGFYPPSTGQLTLHHPRGDKF